MDDSGAGSGTGEEKERGGIWINSKTRTMRVDINQ